MEHWNEGVEDNKPLWERDNVFLHACIAYFVAMILFVCLCIVSGFGVFESLTDATSGLVTEIVATVLIQIVIFLIVPLVIFRGLSKQPMKKTLVGIGFNRPSLRVVGFAFLLGFLFYILNIFLSSVSNLLLMLLGYRLGGGAAPVMGFGSLVIGLVLGSVLPGTCEEVSNRGILMRGFMSKLGVWRAVLLSSLIFGLMHLNIVQFFVTAVFGVFIALAILATRSLWTGIIIHFMNNALITVFAFARGHNLDFFGMFMDFFGAFGGMVFFILPVVMYILILRIIHMFARENFKANEKEYFAEFLKNNPAYVAERIKQGRTVSMEEMSASVEMHVRRLSKTNAIRFYLEGQRKPQKLNAIEKTLVFGIVFLTSVVTAMTLIWGLPPLF